MSSGVGAPTLCESETDGALHRYKVRAVSTSGRFGDITVHAPNGPALHSVPAVHRYFGSGNSLTMDSLPLQPLLQAMESASAARPSSSTREHSKNVTEPLQ
jgi:hypothetical protein